MKRVIRFSALCVTIGLGTKVDAGSIPSPFFPPDPLEEDPL